MQLFFPTGTIVSMHSSACTHWYHFHSKLILLLFNIIIPTIHRLKMIILGKAVTKIQVRVGNSWCSIIIYSDQSSERYSAELIEHTTLMFPSITLHVVVFIVLLYINFIYVLDDDPPSSPETEQIKLSELMPSLPKKSPGSHSDSGRGTLTTEHSDTQSKSKTSKV